MKAPKLLLAALSLAALSTASAQTILWDGTTNGTAINSATNWEFNANPTGASQIGLIDNSLVTPPATINLNTGDFNGATIRLNHAGTTLSTGAVTINDATKFDLVSGGITTTSGLLTLGDATISGHYSQSGGTLTVGTTMQMITTYGGSTMAFTGGNVTATGFSPNTGIGAGGLNSYSITGSTNMDIAGVFSTTANNGVIGGAASITTNSMNLAAAGRIQVLAGTGTFKVDTSFISTNWQGAIDFTGAGYKLDIFGFNLAAYQTEFDQGDLLWNGSNAGTFSDYFSVSGSVLTAVPEPSAWALLAISLTTLVVFRRRRLS